MATAAPAPALTTAGSMKPDVSKLFQQRQEERQQAESFMEKQLATEQQEHEQHAKVVDEMTADIAKDIQETHDLASKSPAELEKYLNLSKLTQPPQPQKLATAATAKKFAPLMLAFGLIGAFFTRGNATQKLTSALAGMGGMVNGMVEGNKEKYQASYQQWKDNTENMIHENETRIQAYRDTLQNRNLNLDQRLQLLQILSSNDPATHAIIKGSDLTRIANHVDALDKAHDTFVKNTIAADMTLKPVQVKPDTQKAVNSVLYGDNNIPKPDKDDPSKNPWWFTLAHKESSYAQFLKNQDPEMTPYEAAVKAHQHAYDAGWIKKGMTEFVEPGVPEEAPAAAAPESP